MACPACRFDTAVDEYLAAPPPECGCEPDQICLQCDPLRFWPDSPDTDKHCIAHGPDDSPDIFYCECDLAGYHEPSCLCDEGWSHDCLFCHTD